ncbi:hypothetical protein BGX21_005449, partial [Mortierella sp. AD011]
MEDDDSDTASTTSGGTQTQQTYPWSNYSLPQLRELLRQRGQLTTGSKSALKKRLKNLERSSKSEASGQPATTIDITTQQSAHMHGGDSTAVAGSDPQVEKDNDCGSKESKNKIHPLRARISSRSNSFSAHFADFISRRRIALETERQEISVYTSPLTVLSYFVLYLLHEFRMALLWIISQQYLLV